MANKEEESNEPPLLLPLVVVQVRPLLPTSTCLCSAFIKNMLLKLPFGSLEVRIIQRKENDVNHLVSGYLRIPSLSTDTDDEAIGLPSSDPSELELIPCQILAFLNPSYHLSNKVTVTNSTLVQILPSSSLDYHQDSASSHHRSTFLDILSGNIETPINPRLQREVFRNHNPETIHSIRLYLERMLAQSIMVGTTVDALAKAAKRQQRQASLRRAMAQQFHQDDPLTKQDDIKKKKGTKHSSSLETVWQPSLLVHSSDHAAGKTLLVQAIAHELNCQTHTISGSQLLAQYGTRADAALESQLHQWVVQAALSDRPKCIILDHLDTFLPPRLSNRVGAGDAAVPILHAMASYLKTLVSSLKNHHSFPFPRSNPLYNVGGTNGRTLSVRICLVGIMTCPDDGWAKMGSASILNSLDGARLKISLMSTATRLQALTGALQDEGITMMEENKDDSSEHEMYQLADTMSWARGESFSRIAKLLRQKLGTNRVATMLDLKQSVWGVGGGNSLQRAISQENSLANNFESVGGCIKAKESLEDALALDPQKRRALARFGMKPPTGVLLYGPPGCGKTLLAKAVASLLQEQTLEKGSKFTIGRGGSFISLKSSEIVQASVGTSEKMLLTAFEVARDKAPSVVFIDEFQALFTERSSGGSSKLASTLLQAMDDIQRWGSAANAIQQDTNENERVVVLGATNTPWMVDKAFLRPGRFDRVVYIDLPNLEERKSILNVHVSRMRLAEGVDIKRLEQRVAETTQGFSGADLAALCRAAAMRCLVESGENGSITEDHFLQSVFNDVAPSSNSELLHRLASWKM